MDTPDNSSFGKPPSGFSKEATLKRAHWLKTHFGVDFTKNETLPEEELQGVMEYHSGYVSIPMGVASPLNIQGSYANGRFAVPLCTLEGALVLSMCRGMIATSLCGGVKTVYVRQEMSRSPVFVFEDFGSPKKFVHWLQSNFDHIKKAAESTTRYGKLIRVQPYLFNRWVVVDMIYETGNAAGQNMVTIATDSACRYITSKFPCRYLLESGFNSDKKSSRRNLVLGRGHSVVAEARLDSKVLRRVLHISVQDANLLETISLPIAHLTGTLGNHLNISNTLSAIYLATGQDVACVAENSVGHTQLIPEGDDLLISLTLPSLTIGTVGGGTRMPMQRKALQMLGCSEGEDSAKKLAEIICAAALTLELSLLSSISSGTFSEAHRIYGRRQA